MSIKKPSARDIILHFSELFLENFKEDEIKPMISYPKDIRLCKLLLEEQEDIEIIFSMISNILSNWSSVVKEFRISGYPTIGLLYSYRASFINWKPKSKNKSSVAYSKVEKNDDTAKQRGRKFLE